MLRPSAWGVVLLACVGCKGSIFGPKVSPSKPLSGADAALTCADASQPLDPGPSRLRRLGSEELTHALKAVLGVDVPKSLVDSIPVDGTADGFADNADTQSLSDRHFDALHSIADYAATNVDFGSWVTCSLGSGASKNLDCHRSLIQKLGPAFFRRTLTQAETDRFVAQAQKDYVWLDADTEAAARAVVVAMAMSPQFLFLVETDHAADQARPDLIPLTGEELVTRLAFLLWDDTPDSGLLAQASSGALATADGVETVVRQMLGDPRSKLVREDFAQRWLRLSTSAFAVSEPGFESLPDAARGEIVRLIDDYFFGDANTLQIFTADHFYANKTLAAVYGVNAAGLTEDTFQRFDANENRGGVFTTASYAMHTSHPTKASRTFRGQFVRSAILCSPPPPPPPGLMFDINNLNEDTHATDPSCASCHKLMDPIGLGLIRYDQLGRLTAAFQSGTDREGQFFYNNNPTTFHGGREFGQIIAGLDDTPRCIVRRTLQWALGRSLVTTDGCTLDKVLKAFADSGYRYDALVAAFVRSDAFRYRKATPTTTP